MRGSPVPDRSAAVTVIISIHASTWEAATIQIQILKEHVLFQFTPLHERQPTAQLMSLKSSSNFNSRLYMRGSSIRALLVNPEYSFQFTPLHERQPSHRELRWRPWSNFNSRLYMRGSVFLMLFFVIIFYFNSRLYMRGSISAAQHLACSIHFNSRLYMRGSLIESHFCSVCQFQFTPLHERQRLLSAFRSSLRYFNSRLYMRGSNSSL